MWARLLNALLGIWLMAAPAVLNYGEPALTNDRIFGPIAASLATVAIWQATRPLRWLNLLVGIWLLLAPWVLSYAEAVAMINSSIVGILMVALALVKGKTDQEFGGGWSALWKQQTLEQEQ